MCCLVLAIEPGSWSWLIVPGSWRIELGCWTIELGWSFKVAGGLPPLPTFEDPSLEEDIVNPGPVMYGVSQRGVALCEFVGSCCVYTRLLPRCWYSWVTCYPVCYCGRHSEIFLYCLLVVTVLVCIRRYIVSVLHVQITLPDTIVCKLYKCIECSETWFSLSPDTSELRVLSFLSLLLLIIIILLVLLLFVIAFALLNNTLYFYTTWVVFSGCLNHRVNSVR